MNSSTLLRPGPPSTTWEYDECDHCWTGRAQVEGDDRNHAIAVNGSSDDDGRVCADCVAKFNAETIAAQANEDVKRRALSASFQLESAYEIHLATCDIKCAEMGLFNACDVCVSLESGISAARFIAQVGPYGRSVEEEGEVAA
jgi:hypothetical protein